MKNNQEQYDDTKMSKKELQKLHYYEKTKKGKEEDAILNAKKEELTPKNQLR